MRTVCWFSCGAASAVAAKLTLVERPDAEVVYCNTMSDEHPDNRRFFQDIQRWLGKTILVIGSRRYRDVDDVIESRRYMAGVKGALCTVELKKIPRFEWQRPDDIHVFGYTADETDRATRFVRNNPELTLRWPLVEHSLDKQACLSEIARAGIELPTMYRLGYRNNNCIGCVKATSIAYWSKIRVDFPEVFAKRAAQSRKLGVKLTRLLGERIFLDEIPPDIEHGAVVENVSCGPECQGEMFAENHA